MASGSCRLYPVVKFSKTIQLLSMVQKLENDESDDVVEAMSKVMDDLNAGKFTAEEASKRAKAGAAVVQDEEKMRRDRIARLRNRRIT